MFQFHLLKYVFFFFILVKENFFSPDFTFLSVISQFDAIFHFRVVISKSIKNAYTHTTPSFQECKLKQTSENNNAQIDGYFFLLLLNADEIP